MIITPITGFPTVMIITPIRPTVTIIIPSVWTFMGLAEVWRDTRQ